MSDTWDDLIGKYKTLTEMTKDKSIPEKLFSRTILCSVNRGILAANTDLDFRLDAMSGHAVVDSIEDNSLVQVSISLADMAEIEGASPTVGNNSAFYVTTPFIHYIPWGFDVVRDHVSAIAKTVHKTPNTPVPVEDLLKFEALLRRLSEITIRFRLHSGKVTNLNYVFSLATNQILNPSTSDNLRREVEREVYGECEIVKPLIEVTKSRVQVASGKLDLEAAIKETNKFNKTFRW